MYLFIEEQKYELGANWIHGVLGNPMYEIAMGNNLIDIINIPKPHKVVAATEDGKQVPFKTLQVKSTTFLFVSLQYNQFIAFER